jgi:hypothetical protein
MKINRLKSSLEKERPVLVGDLYDFTDCPENPEDIIIESQEPASPELIRFLTEEWPPKIDTRPRDLRVGFPHAE